MPGPAGRGGSVVARAPRSRPMERAKRMRPRSRSRFERLADRARQAPGLRTGPVRSPLAVGVALLLVLFGLWMLVRSL